MIQSKNSVFEDERFPIRVVACRESGIDNVEDARRALHEAIEIKYFYEGSSTLLIGQNLITATAGDVIVINPYEFHATVDYGETKGKYHLIMVSLDFFADTEQEIAVLKRRLLSGAFSFETQFRGNEALCRILSLVVEEITERQAEYRIAVRGLMTELLALLVRCSANASRIGDERANAARHYNVIEPALRRVRDGFSEHLTVDELAELCAVSKYHFCRVFKEVTGMTVMQYVNNYRLIIADTMLKSTDRTVAQISRFCGFEDESYFCRKYKQKFGHTTSNR